MYGVKPTAESGAHVFAPGGSSWAVCTTISAAELCVGRAKAATAKRLKLKNAIASTDRMPITALFIADKLVRNGHFRQAKNVFQC